MSLRILISFICLITLDSSIFNSLGDTGQGNGDKTFGKLYWVREYSYDDWTGNAEYYNMQKEHGFDNNLNSKDHVQVIKDVTDLTSRVDSLETSIHSAKITTNLNHLLTQVHHLNAAMVTIQV